MCPDPKYQESPSLFFQESARPVPAFLSCRAHTPGKARRSRSSITMSKKNLCGIVDVAHPQKKGRHRCRPQPLEGEEGDLLAWCLLHWLCVFLHALLPPLLAILHELLRLLPLLRSEH